MVPVVPTLILIGGPGTDDDLFLSIDRKFREPFERKFKQMGMQLTGKTTTYGSGDIVYEDADVVINISGTEYNLGAPTDIFDLISRLKNLDIGWWVEEDGALVVRGFQTYGDFTQDGAAVASPDTDQNNGTVPTVADAIRELALKTSNISNQIQTTAWLLDGNDLLVEKFAGTISEHDYPIRAFNLEIARAFTTGEFGVNITTTPLGTFHAKGRTGQSAAYFANAALTDSWEFRNDGAIYRDNLLYSVPSGTDTTWGQRAGLAIVSQDHNCLFGFECAINLTPGSGDGENNVIIGANAAVTLTTGSNNTILGYLADVSTSALSASIALGTRTTITASNQWVVGATNFPLTDAYFGQGELSTAPVTFTLHGSNASGANVASGDFRFAVGQSRGAGVSGKFIFRNTKTGGGASIAQPHYDTLTIDSTYASLSPHGTAVGNTFELRFLELAAGGTNYVGFKASDTLAGNVIWTLPVGDSTGTQALVSDGAGILSWATLVSSATVWLLDGNTVGSEKFIGTLDNFDFPIRTNNVENVVVFATGQTGFGISASPLGKVHIEGIAGGYALYTEFNAGATQNWSIRDDGELRYASARGAFIDGSAPSSTYFGFNAGINMSDGNTGFGAFVLGGTGAGIENVAMGGLAANKVTSGDGNVFYGYNSGNTFTAPDGADRVGITTGFNSVYIGQRTGAFSNSVSDSIAIGTYAMVRANNQLVIGGSADNAEYYGVNDVYIGQGVSLDLIAQSMGQKSVNIQTTGIGAGQTDISAAVSYLAWCSAVGTGTGIGGDIRFYSAPAGSTGTARNALFRQVDFRGDGFGINYYQAASPLVPGSSVTDGVVFYINDYAGAGTASPFFRTEDGTVISLAALAAGGGANVALSNLAGVAINTTLLPGANDGAALGSGTLAFSDLFLASGSVINFNNGDVTITHASNLLTFAGAASGYIFNTLIRPLTNDGTALGSGVLAFSDLFLASGAVIDFNNGDVVITHSANLLAFSGATSGYTFDGLITQQTNALGVTQLTTAGLALVNATAAALGAQQISPAVRWSGLGWATTGSTSQAVDFMAFNLPVQGATNPTGLWQLQVSINAGAYANVLTVDSTGALFATTSINSPVISAGTQLKATGNNNVSAATYRTTNGGSNSTSFFFTGATTITAGSLSVGYDTTNQLMFIAANGTRNISRAGIQLINLDNTAGSEDADLSFLTQSAGGAMSSKFVITNVGNIYGLAIHNSSVSPTGATNQYLASGGDTAAPSVVATANCTVASATNHKWIRTGNLVVGSFRVDVDPTLTATSTTFTFTLPLASNFANLYDCSGVMVCGTIVGMSGEITADTTNDIGIVTFISSDINSNTVTIFYQYTIK